MSVVAALIFVLGIDLTVEAVWDTRHRVNRMEYITIWVIIIGMTVFDFVIGLFIGIILACVFFVVQSSRRRPIRAVFSGATAKSTVRRPAAQRAFIQMVGTQTYVMKLQGFRECPNDMTQRRADSQSSSARSPSSRTRSAHCSTWPCGRTTRSGS